MATEEEGGFGSAEMASGDEEMNIREAAAALSIRLRKRSLKVSEGESTGAGAAEREALAKIKRGESSRAEESKGKKKVEREEKTRVEEMIRKRREMLAREQREQSEAGKGDERESRGRGEERVEMGSTEMQGGSEMVEGVGKINLELRYIIASVERENNGKISVTRADQKRIREAVFSVQCEMATIMAKMYELQKEVCELKLREREGKSREDGRAGDKVVRKDRGGVVPQMRGAGTSSARQVSSTGVRPRTYADISRGNETSERESEGEGSERIERGVVVVGKDGWKTPPKSAKAGEKALIVSSRR